MGDAAPVGGFERRSDLIDERAEPVWAHRAVGDDLGKRPTAHVPHDEICSTGFAPVVVERHDVGMLETGDELCFIFESADERRIVSEIWSDDLYDHLAADGRLERPVQHTRSALAEAFSDLVAADGEPGSRTAAGTSSTMIRVE